MLCVHRLQESSSNSSTCLGPKETTASPCTCGSLLKCAALSPLVKAWRSLTTEHVLSMTLWTYSTVSLQSVVNSKRAHCCASRAEGDSWFLIDGLRGESKRPWLAQRKCRSRKIKKHLTRISVDKLKHNFVLKYFPLSWIRPAALLCFQSI